MKEETIFPFAFEAPIERFGVGYTKVIWYKVLMVPDGLRDQLPLSQYPRLRIEGEIAEVAVANALMPTGDGRHYVIVSPKVLSDSGAGVGDVVEMRFRIADQDHVDTPPELDTKIQATPGAAAEWNALTPGKKRMLAQHVATAKTAATRARRMNEALEALMAHGADLRAWRRAKK